MKDNPISFRFRNSVKVISGLLVILLTVSIIHSCKDDDDDPPPPSADAVLYSEVTASGYTYYQNAAVLPPDSSSPHGHFILRFNSIAQAALDSTGELPSGSSFPNGSILVKEIPGSPITVYAVMKKDPPNSNSNGGWLWAEYNSTGATLTSVTSKGNNGCISCHSVTPNRDLVRTFDLH